MEPALQRYLEGDGVGFSCYGRLIQRWETSGGKPDENLLYETVDELCRKLVDTDCDIATDDDDASETTARGLKCLSDLIQAGTNDGHPCIATVALVRDRWLTELTDAVDHLAMRAANALAHFRTAPSLLAAVSLLAAI